MKIVQNLIRKVSFRVERETEKQSLLAVGYLQTAVARLPTKISVAIPTSKYPSMVYKRLIILSDGTWQSPENISPTNIMRLALGILREDDQGVHQVILYDTGIGTDNGQVDKMLGGAFGVGMDKNIRDLYTFLALNYDGPDERKGLDGDEIYLFGYSRGAYTVRSLAGMIERCGLVGRNQIQFVKEAYDLYRAEKNDTSPKYAEFQRVHGGTPPIKLVACFDTVGALGIPGDSILAQLGNRSYNFHNTTLGFHIENAIHMLAIDEDREAFEPTMMKPDREHGQKQVTQKFFWGRHGGIGGGNEIDTQCSDITLRFLIEEMKERKLKLAFNKDHIPKEPDILQKPIYDTSESWFGNTFGWISSKYARKIASINDVHRTAITRYREVLEWNPCALKPFEQDIRGTRRT